MKEEKKTLKRSKVFKFLVKKCTNSLVSKISCLSNADDIIKPCLFKFDMFVFNLMPFLNECSDFDGIGLTF